MAAALDRSALIAWFRERAAVGKTVVGAVYAGAAERIERGDFDVQESPRTGDGITPIGLESVAQKKTDPGSVGALYPGPKTNTPLSRKEVLS